MTVSCVTHNYNFNPSSYVMFPIIPYNLAQSSKGATYEEGYGNCSKFAKVIASCDIPRDTVSEPIDPSLICGKLENNYTQLLVELNNANQLTVKTKYETETEIHWIRAINLADDCHGYNSQLCLKNSSDLTTSSLVIQITKPIRAGHELLLWFSEDILARLQMAFLTPANIQGQKKYVCHICSATFEYPNPLKLHLTLECDKYQISEIWNRLSKTLVEEKQPCIPKFSIKLSETSLKKEKYSVLNLSKSSDNSKTSTSERTRLSSSLSVSNCNLLTTSADLATKSSISPPYEVQRPVSEPSLYSSAFKPYPALKKSPVNNNSLRLSQSVSSFTNLAQEFPQSGQLPLLSSGIIQNYQGLGLNHAAQMETLVSNLGKSKQGHLCIYCGKCYSRKYGLKIHIRTHTGYKPLKCKYCLRPFGDPSNLNKHVRLHAEGDTPYKCELCGKVLVRRRDLERHLRSRHMGEMHGEKVDDSINSSSEHSDD